MAKNQVYHEARRFPVPVPVGVVSGDPVVVGELAGVALNSRQDDGTITLETQGAYELTVTGAVTLGAAIYAIVAGGLVTGLTTSATNNTRFGTALAAQAGTGKLPVKLLG
jgi:predicted RecA/RadA family phage recombinase